MAIFTITSEKKDNYLTINIQFGKESFDQLLTSSLEGEELTLELQGYADQYEKDFNNLNN